MDYRFELRTSKTEIWTVEKIVTTSKKHGIPIDAEVHLGLGSLIFTWRTD